MSRQIGSDSKELTGQTAPKPFVFVLMPFDPSFADTYKLGIKPACESAGTYCERVDEQIFAESILARVYNQIAKADVIVADMTGRNPNVFYEVGYAHALNKIVILLTAHIDDIPFDLKHYPHIVYAGSISNLRDELEKRVRWYAALPAASSPATFGGLTISMAGQRLEPGASIQFPIANKHAPVRLSIDLFNDSKFEFNPFDFSMALVVPTFVQPILTTRSIRTLDDRVLYDLTPSGVILAGGWGSAGADVNGYSFEYHLNHAFPAELRVVGRSGERLAISFSVNPEEVE